MHAPTGQMNNGNQSLSYARGDEKFAELFPGLMKKIVAALQSKADEVKQNSESIKAGGYDIAEAIADIKKRLPFSWASEAKEEEPAADENTGPGTYAVTHTASGRTANIEGESLEDVMNKVLTRYPNMSRDDFTIAKQQEGQ
jgi:hypothetical protein